MTGNSRYLDLESIHSVMKYELKPGTSSSFYLKQGDHILPERISLKNYSGTYLGKASEKEIKGTYKKNEAGYYYAMNHRNIHTRIYTNSAYPGIYGHGEIDRRFRIYDLLLFESTNQCRTDFTIHHFKGLALPEYQETVFAYVSKYIKSKSQTS